LWLTNNLLAEVDCWQRQKEALLAMLADFNGDIIFVSNEVGLGIVPLGELSRRFSDEAGWLHQALAKQCQRVIFVVAGLPQVFKGEAL
jgi:adenosylcobinamide kinase/adenosylcobinamide-phosphate guanylyltransferase